MVRALATEYLPLVPGLRRTMYCTVPLRAIAKVQGWGQGQGDEVVKPAQAGAAGAGRVRAGAHG